MALELDVADGGRGAWQMPSARQRDIPSAMECYAALPMDLADASPVLLAEHLGRGRILSTRLRHLGGYRCKSRKPLTNPMDPPTGPVR